jgi:hypothetical protein
MFNLSGKGILRSLTLLVPLAFFVSCSQDPLGPDPLVDVPNTFNIRLIEQLDSTGKAFSLEVTTIEFQDCMEKSVDFNLSQSYNAVLVSLNDIITPDECPDGSAPARSTVLLKDLEIRTYTIDINLKNTVKNTGTLTVLPDQFILEMETEDGFQVLNPELWRIPERTIWGSFSYATEDMAVVVQNFLADLESLCEENTFPEGDYGHFYVVNSESILIPDQAPAGLSFRRNFLFTCDPVSVGLPALMESYRTEYGVDIHINCLDDQGRTW